MGSTVVPPPPPGFGPIAQANAVPPPPPGFAPVKEEERFPKPRVIDEARDRPLGYSVIPELPPEGFFGNLAAGLSRFPGNFVTNIGGTVEALGAIPERVVRSVVGEELYNRAAPNRTTVEDWGRSIRRTGQAMNEGAAPGVGLEEVTAGTKGIGEFAGSILGENVPQIGASTIGALAGGPIGAAAVSYFQNAGEVYVNSLEKGESRPVAAALAGIPMAVLDMIEPTRIAGKLGWKLLEKVDDVPGLKGYLGRVFTGAGTEAGTETVQEAVAITAEPGEILSSENMWRLANSFVGGGIAGGGIGSVTEALSSTGQPKDTTPLESWYTALQAWQGDPLHTGFQPAPPPGFSSAEIDAFVAEKVAQAAAPLTAPPTQTPGQLQIPPGVVVPPPDPNAPLPAVPDPLAPPAAPVATAPVPSLTATPTQVTGVLPTAWTPPPPTQSGAITETNNAYGFDPTTNTYTNSNDLLIKVTQDPATSTFDVTIPVGGRSHVVKGFTTLPRAQMVGRYVGQIPQTKRRELLTLTPQAITERAFLHGTVPKEFTFQTPQGPVQFVDEVGKLTYKEATDLQQNVRFATLVGTVYEATKKISDFAQRKGMQHFANAIFPGIPQDRGRQVFGHFNQATKRLAFNPLIIKPYYTPIQAATETIITPYHELAHGAALGHSEKFAQELERLLIETSNVDGADLLGQIRNEVANVFTDPNNPGNIHPELIKVADITDRGRRRPRRSAGASANLGSRGSQAVQGPEGGTGLRVPRDLEAASGLPGQVWYSWLKRVVVDKIPGSRVAINSAVNLFKKWGVKEEEIKWSGVKLWLAEQKGTHVEKGKLLAYLDENGVKVEEILLGTESQEATLIQAEQAMLPGGEVDMDLEDALAQGLENGQYAPYSDKQLPGGSNYRVLLLTLPGPSLFTGQHFSQPNILVHIRFNERTLPDGRRMLFIEEIQSDWFQKGRDEGFASNEQFSTAELAELRELLKQEDQLGFNTIVEALSAIQNYTDWMRRWDVQHNPRLVELGEKYRSTRHLSFESWIRQIGAEPTGNYQDGHRIYGLREGGQTTTPELMERYKQEVESRPPLAPFSETYHQLAFKRMLRWAAEGGFDVLGWTTGVQQVERYSSALRKRVDSIEVTAKGPRFRQINIGFADRTIQGDNQLFAESGVIKGGQFNGKTLQEVFGSNIAAQIQATTDHLEITGDDLTIGGEGMKEFYDRRLVNFAEKYGKQWGVKPERVNLDVETTQRLNFDSYIRENALIAYEVDPDGTIHTWEDPTGRIWTKAEIMAVIVPFPKWVHTLPLNEALTDSVLNDGQPQFRQIPEEGRLANGQIVQLADHLNEVLRNEECD